MKLVVANVTGFAIFNEGTKSVTLCRNQMRRMGLGRNHQNTTVTIPRQVHIATAWLPRLWLGEHKRLGPAGDVTLCLSAHDDAESGRCLRDIVSRFVIVDADLEELGNVLPRYLRRLARADTVGKIAFRRPRACVAFTRARDSRHQLGNVRLSILG